MYEPLLRGCLTRLDVAEAMAAHWAAFVRDGTLSWDGPILSWDGPIDD